MKKASILCLCLIISLACLAGCGNASHEYATDSAEYPSASPDFAAEQERQYQDNAGGLADNSEQGYGQKIVYSSTLYIETLDYDNSYRAIELALNNSGGHIAYSNQSGGSPGDSYYNARRVYLELKVPAETYETFLNQSENFGNITNRTDSTQDITSSYIDVEARLSALRVQEERLLELLSQAQDVETLLLIESRLSEVRYEIELYTSQKNTYDHMVAFCTVTIDLVEVSNVTPIPTKGFWQEMADAAVGSLRSIVTFLRGLLIVIIFILPYAIIAACVYFFIVRPLVKRSNKKREALLAQQRDAMQMNTALPDEPNANPYLSQSIINEKKKK